MPASCGNITSGYTRVCENIASGVKNIWLANYNSSTVWSSNTSNVVTTATTASPTWYKYEIRQGTCQANEEVVSNDQFGSKNIRQNLELVFIGQNQEARNSANALLGARVIAAIETEEGKFLLFGKTRELEVNAGRGQTDVQAGGETSIRLTMSAFANEFAPTMSSWYVANAPLS